MNLKAVCTVVVLGILVFWTISASAMPKPNPSGTFNQAGFTPPDFSDGDTVTVTAGDIRTFTASCTCARQPGTAPCSGSIVVEVNDGGVFEEVFSDVCNVAEGESCSSSHDHLFAGAGVFEFRIVCEESSGTDYTQDPAEHVTVTVEGTVACTDGETRPCPLQDGVCAGSTETCTGGVWPGCDYGILAGYEATESTCDALDNDCDGRVDFVDLDDDGFGVCGGLGVINELLLTNSNGDGGAIQIFEYRDGAYQEAWSTSTPDVPYLTIGGGEAGDLTGDGLLEIVLSRSLDSGKRLEVWAFEAGYQGWSRIWMSATASQSLGVGDIADFDNDGTNEILVTDRASGRVDLYSYDGNGFAVETTVRTCTNERGALFLAAAGDLDGDGTPEIIFQCDTPDDIVIQEYDGSGYPVVASVPVPINLYDLLMIVDDMETGDVNGDGVDDAVFCGNSGQGHVLTATPEGTYFVEYSSPPPSEQGVFSQTCSVGDMTNDGALDFLVVNNEGAKVYSHDDLGYHEVWVGSQPTGYPGIGTSFVGDADNDGFTEFLFDDIGVIRLYENDTVDASGFHQGASFEPLTGGIASIIIANLNPTNDEAPIDCDDGDPFQGAFEICGDGVDNDCDGLVDADDGCPTDFCGDNYCAGDAAGEMCTTCPDDCGCLGPDCKFGCCGDGVCDRKEDASNCPVDCS